MVCTLSMCTAFRVFFDRAKAYEGHPSSVGVFFVVVRKSGFPPLYLCTFDFGRNVSANDAQASDSTLRL